VVPRGRSRVTSNLQRKIMKLRSYSRAGGLAALLVAAAVGAGPAVTPAHAAPAPASTAVVQAVPQNLGYSYTYSTGMTWPQTMLQTPSSVTTAVANDFRRYFTFDSNCPKLPPVGGTCNLYFPPFISNPVQVVARSSTSFTFLSLPGHAEGAGRVITFTFYKTGLDPFGDIRLHAAASGPYTVAADLSIQSGAAFTFWRTFATNVGRAFG
jgi:hypothetical protein